MPIIYNNISLSPVPLMTVEEQNQVMPDGTNLGSTFQISLHGYLVAVPPGTSPVAADARLGVLLAKQAALNAQFSVSGKTFEVYSPDGSQVTRCNPTVKSIQYSEGVWVDTVEYTIVLEAPNFYAGGFTPSQNVSDISDEWQIEENGYTTDNGSAGVKPVWKLTHNVSAKGRTTYDVNGNLQSSWQKARDWVLSRLLTSNFTTRPFDSSNEMNLMANGQGYNHTLTESINIVDGTFGISETWILAYGQAAIEDYNISVRYSPDDTVDTSVTISGTIRGLSYNLNRQQDRITNAIAYWENSVKNNIFARAQAAVPGVTLSSFGANGTLDYNYAEGTITYNYDFNDRIIDSVRAAADTYTVSKRSSIDANEVTVTVQGTVQGLLHVGEPNSNLLKYQRAKAYFDTINNSTTMLTRASITGVSGLQPATVGTSTDYNIYEGSIGYSFEFNNRLNNLARNEYTVTMRSTRDDGRTNVSVDGSITGLKATENDPVTAKYTNALAFWNSWEMQIPSQATAFVPGISLNPVPVSRSRGDNSYQGVINYNYEYNTDRIPLTPGALFEQVSISDVKPSDVYAVIGVLGRLAGPVLQDIGSKKETTRSLSLEIVMQAGFARPNTDGVIAAYRPSASQVFVDRDEETWVENTSHYSRNITWIYQ